jgi:hypothetical protein
VTDFGNAASRQLISKGTPDVLPTLPGTQPLTPRDLDRGSLIETSASAQLIEERAGLCELVRAKSDKRLRLRFVLTHDLKVRC